MRSKTNSNRIDEEKTSVDSLTQYLISIGEEVSEPKKENTDPPDFWVTVSGIEYAVEVTSITVSHELELHHRHSRLVDDIRSNFANGNMNGTYILILNGHPNIPQEGTPEWNKIVTDAMSEIEAVSNSPLGQEHNLYYDTNGHLSLMKGSVDGSLISEASYNHKEKDKVKSELSDLFVKRINEKQQKLQSVMSKFPNIILVLYEAYTFCDVDDLKEAFKNVQMYEWLHSIYIVPTFPGRYRTSPGHGGLFLYSRNPRWSSNC